MRNQNGFTLLELIVVLAILGILLAIAVPNFLGIHETADNNAQEVQAGLIAKSLKQEFADDYALVNASNQITVDIEGENKLVIGGKIDDNAPIRGHLCFTYVESGDPYPYFKFTADSDSGTITIDYVKSASDSLNGLAIVNYY